MTFNTLTLGNKTVNVMMGLINWLLFSYLTSNHILTSWFKEIKDTTQLSPSLTLSPFLIIKAVLKL